MLTDSLPVASAFLVPSPPPHSHHPLAMSAATDVSPAAATPAAPKAVNANPEHSLAGMTSVQKVDCLEQDPELRGQKYVCLSFLSPEDVLLSREAFMFNRFVGAFSSEMGELMGGLETYFKDQPSVMQSLGLVRERFRHVFDAAELQREYEFFKHQKGAELENEFQQTNNFRTSVRGIKVRGVYDSVPEAKARVEAIRRFDEKFDVYVAEVGCWCPWSPYPEDLQDQEYAETALNSLSKTYQENIAQRDEAYADRKRDLTDNIRKDLDSHRDAWMAAKEKQDAEKAAATPAVVEEVEEEKQVAEKV